MNKITSFTSYQTAEGERLSYTYSTIDDSTGAIIESNARRTVVVNDNEIISLLEKVKNYATKNLETILNK